jgi:anti-anti-sigma regulatory factor
MKMKVNIEIEKNDANEVQVSFRNHGNLALLKHDYILFTLKELITKAGTKLIIDLGGVKFIDSNGFDALNLLSRLGRKYNSTISLMNVEPEAMELIYLVRKYCVFDIKNVQEVNAEIG